MSSLLPYLVTWLQQYGYPALWLGVFVASIGLPLPISLVLLAAGAFAALGDFNIVLLALISISASVAGDNIGYFIGRRLGSRLIPWLEQHAQRVISQTTLHRSRAYFIKRGGWAIFLSRFLLSGFGGSINLLAGAEFYPRKRFILYDVAGETLGAVIPLSLGYVFGTSWDAVGDIFSAVSLGVVALLVTIYLLVRLIKLQRRARLARKIQMQVQQRKNMEVEEAGAVE